MIKNTVLHPNLHYLYNTPKIIYWEVIAGPPNAKLTVLQDHDLLYDKKDYKIRGLNE